MQLFCRGVAEWVVDENHSSLEFGWAERTGTVGTDTCFPLVKFMPALAKKVRLLPIFRATLRMEVEHRKNTKPQNFSFWGLLGFGKRITLFWWLNRQFALDPFWLENYRYGITDRFFASLLSGGTRRPSSQTATNLIRQWARILRLEDQKNW